MSGLFHLAQCHPGSSMLDSLNRDNKIYFEKSGNWEESWRVFIFFFEWVSCSVSLYFGLSNSITQLMCIQKVLKPDRVLGDLDAEIKKYKIQHPVVEKTHRA